MSKKNSKNKYLNGPDRIKQILDFSCRLFSEKSYDAVSVREIADACNCSPALILKYFKSKEAIYSALLIEFKEMCEEPLIKKIPEGDAVQALEKIYNILTSSNDQRKKTYRPNLENAVSTRTSFRSTIALIRAKIQDVSSDIILPLVIRGQKDNVIRQGDPKTIADAVWFAIYGTRLIDKNFKYFLKPEFKLIKELIL